MNTVNPWEDIDLDEIEDDGELLQRFREEGFFKQSRADRKRYGKISWQYMPGLSKAVFVTGCLAGFMPVLIPVVFVLSVIVILRARSPVDSEAYLRRADYRIGRGYAVAFGSLNGALLLVTGLFGYLFLFER